MRVAFLTLVIAVLICPGTFAQNMDPTLVKRAAEWDAAMEAKDAAKLASFYTKDAFSFSEGDEGGRLGPADRQKTFEAMLNMNPPQMSRKILDATASGDIGYILLSYSIPPMGSHKARTGHELQIWKRVEGQWLIAINTFADGPSK